ncbi:MAG TPA: methyltransferase [Devosiaceae bacterium]|nr:methyltransferase [Devosiaceae bacterium]
MSVDHPLPDVKSQSVTTDAFLGGRLTVAQPAAGFRAGLDSVLLGASVRQAGGRLLDLGSGVGVAGLVALAHHPRLDAVFADADEHALGLCARNIAANVMALRAVTLMADATLGGAARQRAGLAADAFDTVIANPPFYDRARATAAPAAPEAHGHDAGRLERWVRTACACLRPSSEAVFIHRAEALGELLQAIGRRLGGVEILPLAPYPGAAASRILVRGVKGSRAPLRLLSPLAVHAAKGAGFSVATEAVLRGETLLDWRAAARAPT